MTELLDYGGLVLAVAALAALTAGASKAGFGSGVAAVATPMLAMVLDPSVAIGAMLPVLMAVDVAAVRAYWRKWNSAAAWRLIAASTAGIAAGAALHSATDPDVFRIAIGGLALAFAAWQGARMAGWLVLPERPMPPRAAWLAGAVAGFTSFVSHSGGPPVLVYLLGLKLPKTEFLATTVLIFWAINLMKLPVYAALGFYKGGAVPLILWMLPFALIGVQLGLWGARRLPERAFFAATYVLLALAGGKLVLDGLA
ncbi:sulfite exporter TauE/SafE family protein [Poseidonocella sp. HB161398]|uniref:sulfite exporter TauE/SafE family protein n=1 Tax=Poseidonocella sp. HB161398 TaxID=2320855 RepID=UPI001107B900|nr:sulfite exporter TauE/SafE family protein [Poseidonocella sp. HB161398]